MKKGLIVFLTCLILSGCSQTLMKFVKPVPFEKRLLVAVGDIQNQSGNPDYNPLMERMTGNFIYELHETECFRLIERQRLKSLLEEYKLGMAGLVDPAKSKEIGKILGVDAILFINLASVNYSTDKKEVGAIKTETETFEILMDSRLVTVETGEILAASKSSISTTNVFSSVGSIKSGEKADQLAVVQNGLEASVKTLAREIAWQISRSRQQTI